MLPGSEAAQDAVLRFRFVAERKPGDKWRSLFAALWPGYRDWHLAADGPDSPSLENCRRALRVHMPELLPVYDRACNLAGSGEMQSRFLSLYRPPAYDFACSQAVWPGPEACLVRNYDYRPDAFDAIVMRSEWLGRGVLGMTDCLMGLLDGINEDGLAVSLTSGGRTIIGDGFGIPLILRYVLETCRTVGDAITALERLPSHMAYNVTVLDRSGLLATVLMAPGQDAVVTHSAVATNHQEGFERDATERIPDTVQREQYVLRELLGANVAEPEFISAFLAPPLYCTESPLGFTTLYTAAYRPGQGDVDYLWPGASWRLSLNDRTDAEFVARLPEIASVAPLGQRG